ncbi:MAG: hypothetical protein JW782_03210 [Candidatus Saganbacteria bacterium]|nr:hypothetical protein [Candidatus Saganbacteria bacterium]
MDLNNKPTWRKLPTSAYFLLSANAVPLCGVLFMGWGLMDILFLYWAESAVIGFYGILKILLVKNEGSFLERTLNSISKVFGCVFFTIHFGGFMAGHAIFLWAISTEFFDYQIQPWELFRTIRLALLLMFVSHGYSFLRNYIAKGERFRESGSNFMLEPYSRIIVMHLTLIFGMLLVFVFGQPALLLVCFIALKTLLDLTAHLRERSKFALK